MQPNLNVHFEHQAGFKEKKIPISACHIRCKRQVKFHPVVSADLPMVRPRRSETDNIVHGHMIR